MVGRKPPCRLEDAARGALAHHVGFIVVWYLQYDTFGLMRAIEHLRSTICICVPRCYEEFVAEMLRQISNLLSPELVTHYKDVHGTEWLTICFHERKTEVVEPISDVCPVLMSLFWLQAAKDFQKIRNLRTFHCEKFPDNPLWSDEFISVTPSSRMENLTTFIYRVWCNDEVLRLVAGSCPNLVNLDISRSTTITEDGLNVLSRCSKINELHVDSCYLITGRSISKFLAKNSNVSNLTICSEQLNDIISLRPRIYHPSVKTLSIEEEGDLSSIVSFFPNLRSLSFCPVTNNIAALASMPELVNLGLVGSNTDYWYPVAEDKGNLVSKLRATYMQGFELDSFHLCCPNLEELSITECICLDEIHFPEFPHLRKLVLNSDREWDYLPILRFTARMPALEYLELRTFEMEYDDLTTMLTDSINFPKLKELVIYEYERSQNVTTEFSRKHLIRFVADNNLHIKIIIRQFRTTRTRCNSPTS